MRPCCRFGCAHAALVTMATARRATPLVHFRTVFTAGRRRCGATIGRLAARPRRDRRAGERRGRKVPGYHAGPGNRPRVRGSCPQAVVAASRSWEKSPNRGACRVGIKSISLGPVCRRPLREWVPRGARRGAGFRGRGRRGSSRPGAGSSAARSQTGACVPLHRFCVVHPLVRGAARGLDRPAFRWRRQGPARL